MPPRRILIGSTNPSKVAQFNRRFSRFQDVTCICPTDLELQISVEESGATVAENARLKAEAYFQASGLPVISLDSGLFFREFSLEDPRQPGTHVRRVHGKNLNDEEMIAYYSNLARQFGPLHACWINAFGAADETGLVQVFSQDDLHDPDFFDAFGFLLWDTPHPKRNPGWPLDSLSADPYWNQYWFDIPDEAYQAPALAHRRSNQKRFHANLDAFFQRVFKLQYKVLQPV